MASTSPEGLPSSQQLQQAADCLKAGKLVVFPTETVYGLGADAKNPAALQDLYRAKGRPTDHPVIVHIASPDTLKDWAVEIPDIAYALAAAFWPGPMTLILKRARQVPDAVTGGQETVGLRIPQHPVALALLQAFGGGIAAPSANRFGRLSPTRLEDVEPEILEASGCALEGGPCPVGVESTIVDLSGPHPVVLRPGMVLPAELEAILGQTLPLRPAQWKTRASGTLPSHYAPQAPVRLLSTGSVVSSLSLHLKDGLKIGVLAYEEPLTGLKVSQGGAVRWIKCPSEPQAYAQALYANLKKLDREACDEIWVELPPEAMAWEAVHDRLQRAAATPHPQQIERVSP
jgi:L-threonylcarbamoyladenylate synthase